MSIRPRQRFSSEIMLNPVQVSEFARNAGDFNPLHHDPEYAASTKHKRLIASGPHTTALLMGLTATYFSQNAAMVGLEFWFRFKKPVFADETIRLEWLIISVKPHARLKGDIVELRGRLLTQDGTTAIGAKGRVLVTEKL